MKFEKDKAEQIIQKFGLSEKTLNVWKTRGKIPSKYLEMEKRPVRIDSEKDKSEWKKIINILKTGLINKAQLSKLTEIKQDRIIYLQNGRGLPYREEFLKIKKLLNEIRIELKSIDFSKIRQGNELEIEKFLELNGNKLLVWNVILDRDKVARILSSLRLGTQKQFPYDRLAFIEQKILEFLLRTQI
ncbi:hypothetical protein GO491_11985 [Flavobacteriaceae bacterium Ap0902]|nr:hypothetical protein [Flavobacteriaceae bacterium Ap0902]